jgi:hypothetical protein
MSCARTGRQVSIALAAVVLAGCGDPKVEGPAPPGPPAPGAERPPAGGGGFVLPPAPPPSGPGSGGEPGMAPPGSGAPGPAPGEICAVSAFTPEKVPVDIHMLIDSSASMGEPAGGQRKWDRALQAIDAFVSDPKSAGLGVGVTFYPNRTPTNVNTCRLDYYTSPAVPIAPLPMNQAAIKTAIYGRAIANDTPTRPAMNGSLGYLRSHAMMNGDRRPVFLLITDGLPNGCMPGNTVAEIADFLRSNVTGAPSITTYAIGVFGEVMRAEGEAALNSWAQAGSSDRPFVLSATEDLGQKLLDALNEIRGAALACQFLVPANMAGIDFAKVNVRVQSAGGSEEIVYVRSADRCDPAKGGWHYDVDPSTGTAPTRVIMCEVTCKKYRPEATAKVDLLFGCKTRTID